MKDDPDQQVIGEVLEPMRKAGRSEEKIIYGQRSVLEDECGTLSLRTGDACAVR